MTSRISGIVPLLLITLVCIGLVEGGYQIIERYILDDASSPVEMRAMETTPEKSAEKPVSEKKSDYRIILQRNLFASQSASESIGNPVADPAQDLQATSLAIVLMGTITGSEGTARAFILDKKNQQQDVYQVGSLVQGALIKEISRGKVILSYAGKDEILDMSEAANVRPPVRVVPPVIAGQSNTSARVGPEPVPGALPVATRAANVNRARRALVRQRGTMPSRPPKQQ